MELDVFIKECRNCKGTGSVACDDCQGFGSVYDPDDQNNVCEKCSGNKKIECIDCAGAGRLVTLLNPHTNELSQQVGHFVSRTVNDESARNSRIKVLVNEMVLYHTQSYVSWNNNETKEKAMAAFDNAEHEFKALTTLDL